MSKFYDFNQNNSGGGFDFNEEAGITHHVIIEANSEDQAIARAVAIGIYFDGCEDGTDCPCCGDRWSTPWGGDDEPQVYGQPFKKHTMHKWMAEGKEICVHYLDGRKEWA